MYVKIRITGSIEVMTGMHIGGNSAFSAIGAVDSPIVKDFRTGDPMIPGSSLKGKMRTLLARKYNTTPKEPNNDEPKIKRLFGSSKKGAIHVGRLLFSDMILENWETLKSLGAETKTEIKFENSISRMTGVANPRQIERAIRGSVFPLDLIYECDEKEKLVEDFKLIAEGMKLLQYDYLGGNGSRGYGKIAFHNLKAEVVVGSVEEIGEDNMKTCRECLNQVNGKE